MKNLAPLDARKEGRRRLKGSLWLSYVILGLIAAALYPFMPRTGAFPAVYYLVIHASSVVFVFIGIRAHRPQPVWGWYTVAVGNAFSLAGDTVFFLLQGSFKFTFPYPGPSDALYLTAYPLLLVGLWGLVRTPATSRRWTGIIDSTIVTAGLSSISWVFIIAPAFRLSGLSELARLVTISYPFIDILLLAVLVRLLLSPGRLLPVHWLLGAAIIGQLIADSYYSVSSLQATFSYASPFLVAYLLSYVSLGAAAIHPTMAKHKGPMANAELVLTQGRLAFLALSALVPPALIVLQSLLDASPSHATGSIVFMACVSALLFLLVLVRMRGLMVDIAEHQRVKELKDEFTSVVSHELRTPLTSMSGALGLVASGVLGPMPDKAKRMIDIAVENSSRLIRLINDILDIDKMESGNLSLDKRALDVGKLMIRASDEMKGLADQAGVNVSLFPQDLQVWADHDRVTQVLTNLLSNAIKFSPRGGTVGLSAERQNGKVQFAVFDEGSGIPQGKLETVFERFKQLDSSDSRAKGGTGLGLAICRKIVTQHGGRIWAESPHEKGTTLNFTLPRAKDLPAIEHDLPSNGLRQAPRVLVCDDDPAMLDFVRVLLEQRGYRVTTVSSGEEALESVMAEPPEIVVLDLLMPGMNGWDVAAQLKRHAETDHVPIIILSLVSRQKTERTLPNVVDWVPKPVDESALMVALDKAICYANGIHKVLIVEDDLDLARVLTAMLEQRGLEAWHAATSEQAVELARRTTPDLVILDLILPDGNGVDVVDSLRRSGDLPAVPVVVYTAHDLDDSQRDKLRSLNALEILTKGRITPEEFEFRVMDLVARMAPGSDEMSGRAT